MRSLIDRDLVVPRGGQYVLAAPDSLDLDAIGAPASLQALITARLDTLPAAQRRVLDQASVIGGSFTRDAIANLCPDVVDSTRTSLRWCVSSCCGASPTGSATSSGSTSSCRTRSGRSSYGTLSRRDRKASHLAVLRLLEEEGDESGELAPIIAQHYLEALDAVPEDPDRQTLAAAAVNQLQRAAARTAALGAPAEAADHLAVALERCDDPSLIPRIEVELADQLTKSGRYEAGIEHAERARDALDDAGETELAVKAASVLAQALIGIGGYERAFAVASERRDQAAACSQVLEVTLIRSLIGARLRMGGEIRDLAEDSARLAEKLGDPSQIANSYVSLALHYMIAGPHGLGRMLLESAAESAREAHDGLILCRALGNLNADWTQDDAARAADYGREAAAAARALGDHYWTSSTALNLTFALAVRGAWDEALLCCDGEAVDPLDRSMSDLMRGRILLARGQDWERLEPVDRDGDQDPVWQAFNLTGAALDDLHHARVPDLSAMVRGVGAMFAHSGIFDDFSTLWQVASEVALQAQSRKTLDDLLTLVESDARNKLPRGLEAQTERIRGQLAIQDDAEPAVIEQHLRAAIAGSEAWRSEPTVARSLADLGIWLTREGRSGEAVEPLERAREIFDRLGAVAWSAQLDARAGRGSRVRATQQPVESGAVDDDDPAPAELDHTIGDESLQDLVDAGARSADQLGNQLLGQRDGDRALVRAFGVDRRELPQPAVHPTVKTVVQRLEQARGELLDPPRHQGEQQLLGTTVASTELAEDRGAQGACLGRLQGHHRRRAHMSLVVEQRQLPEVVARADHVERDVVAVLGGDPYGESARGHQVEAVGRVALVDEHLTAHEGTSTRGREELVTLLVVERGEQGPLHERSQPPVGPEERS